MLPYYKPLTDDKNKRNIDKMQLFARETEGKEVVELDDVIYPGLDQKYNPGDTVTITELARNRVYKLACAGYIEKKEITINGEGEEEEDAEGEESEEEDKIVNNLGDETNEIVTCFPLNLKILSGYLAQIAYKLGHYQVAKKSAELLLTQYIIKNEVYYPQLDNESRILFSFRINYKATNWATSISIKQLMNCLLILADVSKIQAFQMSSSENHSNQAHLKRQLSGLRIINFLMLALELGILMKDYVGMKRILYEIYDHLRPYLSFSTQPKLLIYCLIFCHQSLRLIPRSLIDSPTRRIGT